MAIREAVTISNGRTICDTVVSVSGMKLTIGIDELIFQGESLVFDERFEHDIASVDERISLAAWLVKKQSTDELIVLVDECLPGMRGYQWGDSDLEMMLPLVHANIPASVADLESSDILVHRAVRAPSEELGGR